jgi:integrase
MSGWELEAFSAHGLRARYLTEAARQGIGLPDAMQQSQHRSVQQAASYHDEAEGAQGRAARLGLQRWSTAFVEVRPRLRSLDSRAE